MKKVIAALATAAMVMPVIASADALSDARDANICDVTAAEYLADGRLKVTCRAGTVNPAYANAVAQPLTGGVTGGTLSGTAIGGIAAGALLLAIVIGDDDETTTTTTTTTGGS
ncbi:hypothetical protein K3727_21630 (plasmid) [Rhodobacteraceae bacterium M382]|nr:hypothetical protein K3727_21630 [Rhodobacteraceae bacterium M382]